MEDLICLITGDIKKRIDMLLFVLAWRRFLGSDTSGSIACVAEKEP